MTHEFSKNNQIALAIAAAVGVGAAAVLPATAHAEGKTQGRYLAGDFHNHTTCSDGSISMQKLIKKSTDRTDTPWGLDWFVQAGHGGNGNRNCTLVEDASLETPVYPLTTQGPQTTWQNTVPAIAPKGLVSGTAPNQNMWRWQSIQEFQYPLIEYMNAYKNVPLFLGVESVVAGHEHSSMSVITGQIPAGLSTATLPTAPVIAPNTSRYAALGSASALAQWEYCFDRGDSDTSRGNLTVGTAFVVGGNNWDCSVPGSLNAVDISWNVTAQKLLPASGLGNGTKGHLKTLEALKWMVAYHPGTSYYVPAHLERAGPFYPDGNNGYNVEHLRDFNDTAPTVAFGFESQPGHGASANRGEYQVRRNNIGGVLVDSVGGTTFGGTGVYAAQVGGLWDALLGEGRNWWFFASSDWHNRGSFGPDDRRSTQDFYPGEYQRNYALVTGGRLEAEDEDERHDDAPKATPQAIVDALRGGNNYAASGQLIDRLAFVACASYRGDRRGDDRDNDHDGDGDYRSNANVEALAVRAATHNAAVKAEGCATMGEKLKVRRGAEIVVSVVVRDPAGPNYSPYTFNNPSLAQVGISQPLNLPVLDHVDLIRATVSGYKAVGAADYAGEWPRNWLAADGSTLTLASVPAAAKNTTAAVIRSFSGAGGSGWTPVVSRVDGTHFLKMSYRIPAVSTSQYVRLRGTNLPAAVPFETDASGNPLPDVFTNAGNTAMLRIPCAIVGTTQFDGCPSHLATATGVANPIVGKKAVSFDIAAWADLWFYSNPIYVEVRGSTTVAGVQTRVRSFDD
jgi:hypothetical protein